MSFLDCRTRQLKITFKVHTVRGNATFIDDRNSSWEKIPNIDENNPCLNFESLQRNINFSNLNSAAGILPEPLEDFMVNTESLRDFLRN